MQKYIMVLVGIGMLMVVPEGWGQVKLSGYFIARSECPVYQSLRKKTNPGNMMTRENYAYPLIAKNKSDATYYLITLEDGTTVHRWVDINCGEHVVPVDKNILHIVKESAEQQNVDNYILAISWQPGFCETKPSKPECLSQSEGRYDTSHFSLHGLWPQPRENVYCDVPADIIAKDKDKRWADLRQLSLDSDTRETLYRVMPGTKSFLHRHEWIKHGTCYNSQSAEVYFKDSLNMMAALNSETSEIRNLFVNNIGKKITSTQIASAFDHDFGTGAGEKIKISCKRDGNRKLITEITISLQGDLGEISLGDALKNSIKARDIGCTEGIVDPVGLQ